MRRAFPLLAFAWLAGCASALFMESSSGGTGTASGGGVTGGFDGGGIGSGGHSGSSGSQNSGGAGGSTGGADGSCDPTGLSPCGTGEVCDQTAQICRLPGYGEGCDPSVGCASQPPGMTCTEANFDGSSQELCLVACSATDSSSCPYGTSCGDPDLPGYCSPAGSGSCTPWLACSLGANLTGLCVPSGQGASCVAAGSVAQPFASCDPHASNSDATDLCAAGMICLDASALPETLGTAPGQGGVCVPPCGGTAPSIGGAPSCASDQHCLQPYGSSYGLCLPGSTCSLGTSKTCPFGWWCLPDSIDAEAGGCVQSVADAGATGAPCQQPLGLTTTNPCADGDACLADPASPNGGASCQMLCLLSGSENAGSACATCTPLGDGGGTPVGVCQ